MKSPSLESIYASLEKSLRLIESYTEIPKLAFLFRACRLKPHSYFFEKKDNKIILYAWWFDEFSNSIKLTKSKKLKIIYGDLSLDRDKVTCTDLYYGLSIKKILKISKLAFISCGTDEDMYQDCALISLLGIDDYLRTYLYVYGYWQQVSPLFLGIKNLKIIAKNLDLRGHQELSKSENRLPCTVARTWLTCVPISEEFSDILDKQCGIVLSAFKQS
jgi:hypothetical protein